MERTEQSRPCTAVPQLTELAPRPTEPKQRLTATPLPRNLDPYKVPETATPATVAPAYTPPPPFRAPLARDLFDDELRPANWNAFGQGPGAA
jgi:hypothetical protein